MYENRFYREWMESGELNSFRIAVGSSDLFIMCDRSEPRELALKTLREVRGEVENYILSDNSFLQSLSPMEIREDGPDVVKRMADAAKTWNVGPMAAVAGAVAQSVGQALLEECDTVIVENGGDVFARANRDLKFALYAGEESPFRDQVAFKVDARAGVGVCTSSGVVGPSVSFGVADAVVAVSPSAAVADAAATSIANQIKEAKDIDSIIEQQNQRSDLTGLIACLGDRLGIFGDIEITQK